MLALLFGIHHGKRFHNDIRLPGVFWWLIDLLSLTRTAEPDATRSSLMPLFISYLRRFARYVLYSEEEKRNNPTDLALPFTVLAHLRAATCF